MPALTTRHEFNPNDVGFSLLADEQTLIEIENTQDDAVKDTMTEAEAELFAERLREIMAQTKCTFQEAVDIYIREVYLDREPEV